MGYRRSQMRNKKLKKLAENTGHLYTGAWYNEEKHRYIKVDTTNKWLKKHSSRQIRRKLKNNYEQFGKNCSYRKLYDYWWELF